MDLLPALAPRELTTLGEVRLDGQVLGFTFLLSLLTLFFFSLAPMWQVSRTSLNEVLKDTPSAPRGNGLRSLLVVAEVALTIRAAGRRRLDAAQLAASAQRPARLRRGKFADDSSQPASFSSRVGKSRERLSAVARADRSLARRPKRGAHQQRAAERLSQLPHEFYGRGAAGARASNDQPVVGLRFISPNYFRTMSIPLVAGRSFTEADTATAPRVAIVNEAFVRRYLSGLAPLGQKLLRRRQTPDEIVGVVSDFKYEGLQTEAEAGNLRSARAKWFGAIWRWSCERASQPETLTAAVQRAVWQVEKNVGVVAGDDDE